jgi:hypothetical protein
VEWMRDATFGASLPPSLQPSESAPEGLCSSLSLCLVPPPSRAPPSFRRTRYFLCSLPHLNSCCSSRTVWNNLLAMEAQARQSGVQLGYSLEG